MKKKKECGVELKTVSGRTRRATNTIESMGATIKRLGRKDWDLSIWEDKS